jgi:hypothetical protein
MTAGPTRSRKVGQIQDSRAVDTAVIGENFLYVFERRVAGTRHKDRSWMLQWSCPEEGGADCVKQPPACSRLHVSIRPVPPRIGRWTVIVVARGHVWRAERE